MREVTRGACRPTTGYDLSPHRRRVPTAARSPPTPSRCAHLAHAFARVGTGTGLNARTTHAPRNACARAVAKRTVHGGRHAAASTRAVMERLGERLFCKVGAEGMYWRRAARTGPGPGDQDGRRQHRTRLRSGAGRGGGTPAAAGRRRPRTSVHGCSDIALSNWNGIEVGRMQATQAPREGRPPNRPDSADPGAAGRAAQR
jgi:hypothetical protein